MTNDTMKDDVNRGIRDFLDSVGQTYAGAFLNKDDKMKKVLEAYKQELLCWSQKEKASHENPMKHATQEHWYSLYLEKKRLESHNCQVQYAEYKHINRRPLEDAETICSFYTDGKYMICKAGQTTRVQKNYIRNNWVIGQEKQTYEMDYYIISSQNKDGLYVCPGCGAEQSLDTLLDGCDYCKSKFDISAYEDKVMSVMKHNNMFETRVIYAQAPSSAIVLAVIGTIGVFFGLMCALITLGLSLIFAVAGGLAIYFAFKISMEANKDTPQSTAIKYRLQDHNPSFSEEEFIGSLDCKLKAIHYASDVKELTAFVKCDIRPFVESYQNIVNCETGKLSYKSYQIQGDYQYLELHREIKVMQDCGNYLKPASGIVKVKLAKKVSHKLKNDVVLYRCGGCGATISPVEGGKCKYCGNEMDYAAYDWVVVGYQHVNAL